MARPPAKHLTHRELELMHVFWLGGQMTAAEVRDRLAAGGHKLAYTTVATLIRILSEKGFVEQTNTERPFQYRLLQSFEEVSRDMLNDFIEQVFQGSRKDFIRRLVEYFELAEPQDASFRGARSQEAPASKSRR